MAYVISILAIAGIGYLVYRGIKSNKLFGGTGGGGTKPNDHANPDKN